MDTINFFGNFAAALQQDVVQREPYLQAGKAILSDPQVLAHLIKGCFKEYKDCTIDQIVNQYLETPESFGASVNISSSLEEMGERVPLFFTLHFNVLLPDGCENDEDKKKNEESLKRSYLSIFLDLDPIGNFAPQAAHAQLAILDSLSLKKNQEKEKEFVQSYSIWIGSKPNSKFVNCIKEVRCENTNIIGNDSSSIKEIGAILIGLGEEYHEGLLRFLDLLFSSRISPKKKEEILEQEYQLNITPILKKAFLEIYEYPLL